MDPNNPKDAKPVPFPPAPASCPEGQWSTDLFDCWDDGSTCCLTCVCPCIAMGRMVEIIDRGTTTRCVACALYYALSSVGCGWLYACTYRSKLRGLFKLPEAPCVDGLVHGSCCLCAISQEYRELKNRGVDPSIGWEANVEKWKREGVTSPPIAAAPGMAR
ncbi:unnamed protein product [Ilex paraguariensis]|uniref:Uncharacterized protein n=1 Tax=Ilex paraguariensis TaxID=185542 RepID=A0ABC8SQZ4_9AQUA